MRSFQVQPDFPARCAWLSQFPAQNGKPAAAPVHLRTWLRRAGYVQIDTISVVARAHHHVLWSRDHRYAPAMLDTLESAERGVFEYWAHAAAYLPIEDYRFCLPRMRRIAATGHEWFPTDRKVVELVRNRIRSEGPLRSQDFASEGKRGPWWDWKPAKAALEFLFMSGELMVASRQGFQKVYDLTERVLPAFVDRSEPDGRELAAWYLDRATSALGCFRRRDLAYQRKDGLSAIQAELDERLADGRLVRVEPHGAGSDAWFTTEALLELAGRARIAGKAAILSPFDNLIIDRQRTEALYGFRYTLECYLPAAKRQFGYFSLPIFISGRPVGTVDCKAERGEGRLLVRRCSRFLAGRRGRASESAACSLAELLSGLSEAGSAALNAELAAFAAFNGCDRILQAADNGDPG